MKNKVLVTGGAGFIGSHVAEELVKAGHEVIVLDDLSGGFEDNVPRGAQFVKGSILDEQLIKDLFAKHSFDHVYHLAAYAAEGLSHFIKKFNHENNLIGSINLINASVNHGVKCFIFTSSIAVYGENQVPMTEELTPLPEDSYGIAKLAVEQELKASLRMFGLPYIVFRPHNVYGERQNLGDKYRNVAGIFMNQILLGRPLTIYGDGLQRRAFTYIKDIAPLIAGAVSVPGALNQVFNIGADQHSTVNELAEKVCAAMGAAGAPITHLDARNEVKIAFSSHEKIRRVFGAVEPTTLDKGLKAMADWAKRSGSRSSSEFKNIEIRKNLPPSWR